MTSEVVSAISGPPLLFDHEPIPISGSRESSPSVPAGAGQTGLLVRQIGQGRANDVTGSLPAGPLSGRLWDPPAPERLAYVLADTRPVVGGAQSRLADLRDRLALQLVFRLIIVGVGGRPVKRATAGQFPPAHAAGPPFDPPEPPHLVHVMHDDHEIGRAHV